MFEKGALCMDNLTPDGKIKTIRCVKATHEDFAKLVNLGKDAKNALEELEKKWNYKKDILAEEIKKDAYATLTNGTETKTKLDIYIEMVKKDQELASYHNAYHVLMEEGVNELLATIGIGQDSYDYDFYQLCLDN